MRYRMEYVPKYGWLEVYFSVGHGGKPRYFELFIHDNFCIKFNDCEHLYGFKYSCSRLIVDKYKTIYKVNFIAAHKYDKKEINSYLRGKGYSLKHNIDITDISQIYNIENFMEVK